MGGDPFGQLLRQRIVFLGGEVRISASLHAHTQQFVLALADFVNFCAGQ